MQKLDKEEMKYINELIELCETTKLNLEKKRKYRKYRIKQHQY